MSKVPQPFTTFHAVKSTKMDKKSKVKKRFDRKSSRDSGSTQVFAVALTRRKWQTHSGFFLLDLLYGNAKNCYYDIFKKTYHTCFWSQQFVWANSENCFESLSFYLLGTRCKTSVSSLCHNYLIHCTVGYKNNDSLNSRV